MSVRERILSIRLMEKLRYHPVFAQRLGIETVSRCPDSITESNLCSSSSSIMEDRRYLERKCL